VRNWFFNAIPIASEPTNFLLNTSEKKFLLKLKYNGDDKSVKISNNTKILDNNKLKRVKNFISSKVLHYAKEVLCINNTVRMTQSWATINKKGSQHHEHAHPNTFISLVYYVDCDLNSGDLIFVKDRSSLQDGFYFNLNITRPNEYNATSWIFKTMPGFLCIFPGHIKHFSSIHEGDRDRVMIGANFFLEGEIGQPNNTDMMRLNVG
tara:strand:+ start:139 stop:759 length:621 start_codon:yes stop_codon:yes gene_type:complete